MYTKAECVSPSRPAGFPQQTDFWKETEIMRVQVTQICFFRAAAGKALTMVFAGCALTFFSSPNIILTPAFVAGFTRVLMRQRPGIVKIPFFFTSLVAMVTKLSNTSRQTFCFNSCSSASADVRAPFVMTLLLLAFVAFIAFIAFIAFMGAMILQD